MSKTDPTGETPDTGVSDSTRPPADKTIKYDTTPGPAAPSGSDASRDCIHCGERFTGLLHTPCPANANVENAGGAPAAKGFGDLPPEVAEAAADPARSLNQYVLVRQIGKGGMGVVWKAWDRTLTRWVAIKFLLAEEEGAIARFRREAQISARLRHPNIAAIYEVGQATMKQLGQDQSHFLVMEFVDGQTLAGVTLPLAEVLEIFLRIAKAVDSAHRAGVVHRDLKPANIMITKDKWPYVMDFGLAKALEGDVSMSVSGAVIGTPAFMPPEQAEGRLDQIDARSDVYSLAATLYTVLLGRPPFGGSSAMQVILKVSQQPPASPRSIQPDFPERLEAVLLKAMSKDRKDRHPSVAAFGDDLAVCLAEARVGAATAPAPRKSRTPVLAGVVLVAALAVAAAVFWKSAPPQAPAVVDEKPEPRKPVNLDALPPATAVPTFTLSIAVHPYASLVRFRRGDQEVLGKAAETPLSLGALQVADYDLVLSHPQFGERTVHIPASLAKPGRTVLVWGKMSEKTLNVSESP